MIVDDIIAAIVIVVIVGLAIGYIVKEKRRGAKCIGCPYGKTCSGGCSTCSGDLGEKENNTKEK